MTAGPTHDCPTRAAATAQFREYFTEHPDRIKRMPTVINVKGTKNESPDYPGKAK